MATATYTGPKAKASFGGFTFYQNEPRPLPLDVAQALSGKPWFSVDVPAKRKPGRPRKADK